MTTTEAAAILDVTPGTVQDLVRDKQLRGRKVLARADGGGRRWQWDVNAQDVRRRRRMQARRVR